MYVVLAAGMRTEHRRSSSEAAAVRELLLASLVAAGHWVSVLFLMAAFPSSLTTPLA